MLEYDSIIIYKQKFYYVSIDYTCSANLLQLTSVTANATSGSAANIGLDQAGWTASATGIQSVTFTFPSLVQLYVLRISCVSSSCPQTVSVSISNTTLTWTTYSNGSGDSIFYLNCDGPNSTSVVLNPPIVTRFLQLNVSLL